MSSPTQFGRLLPNASIENKPLQHSLEAERAVLGAILLDNSAIHGALEYLEPRNFFLPEHQKLFRHMMELSEAKQGIDSTILFDKLTTAGELELCGGIGYISQLGNDLPRATNIRFYARIVLEKSRLRMLAYAAQDIQQQALDGTIPPAQIASRLTEIRNQVLAGRGAKLVSVDIIDFLTMDLPPLEYVIEPLLSARGRGMVYAQRGAGKTYACMEIGYSVAMGEQAFVWPVEKARPVKYIEGEMDGAMLQDRFRHLCRKIHGGRTPEPNKFRLVAKDLPNQTIRPRINTNEGRAQVSDILDPGDLLFLDNLTALSPSSDEKESEDWAQIQEWLIDLSCQGISTIVVHHAGWNAEHSRGSSKREDLCDFVLRMKLPQQQNDDEDEAAFAGLRAEVQVVKMRGRSTIPSCHQPFELELTQDAWIRRPLWRLLRERAVKLLESGAHPNDVVKDTGLSRYSVLRLRKKMKMLPGSDVDQAEHESEKPPF